MLKDGDLLAWGRGHSAQRLSSSGAAAHSSITVATAAFSPRQLEPSAFDAPLVHITANGCSSAAVSAAGSLYTWGFGESGALCNGGSRDENRPFLANPAPAAPAPAAKGKAAAAEAGLQGTRVLAAGMGGQHLVVLAELPAHLLASALPSCKTGKAYAVLEDPEVEEEEEEEGEE